MEKKNLHRLGLLAILLSWSFAGVAQLDKAHKDTAMDVREYYNAGKPEKIYALTSNVFRKKMTSEQFSKGMVKYTAKNGKWHRLEFASKNDRGVNFTAVFENSEQILSIKVDHNGQIERINFEPVTVKVGSKNFQVASDNKLITSLDQKVERLVRPYIQQSNTTGLVIAIVDQGKIHRYSYGTVDKKTQYLPKPATTIFEIGSVTKTFNALLLAELVVKGKMKLQDPINQYLPDSLPLLAFRGNPIRLVHLANHTAGLPRLPENIFSGKVEPQDPYKHYNTSLLFSYLRNYKIKSLPGTKFSYSNLGAGLLGTILERSEKQSYEDLLINKICRTLGMNNTSISLNSAQEQNFAQGYNEEGKATAQWDLASLKGSGAIRSTLDDIVLYAQAQLGGKNPLEKAIKLSHEVTFTNITESMGLGWRINNTSKSPYLHHSGGTGGFRSFVGFDRQSQFAVVILSNSAVDVTGIGQKMMDR